MCSLAGPPVVGAAIGAHVLVEERRRTRRRPPAEKRSAARRTASPSSASAHVVRVPQVVDRQRAHARAAVRDVLGEPEPLELPHGLAHRHRAHVQRLREPREPERLAGRQLAGQDRLLELGDRLLGERPVAAVVPVVTTAPAQFDI